MNRGTLLAALTSVAVLSVAAGGTAQTPDDYPNRPIRIIVPQAAGSGVDLQARVLAQKMGELWGQQRASWRIARAPTPSSEWKLAPRRSPTATR
jgi:hypothetical protein